MKKIMETENGKQHKQTNKHDAQKQHQKQKNKNKRKKNTSNFSQLSEKNGQY